MRLCTAVLSLSLFALAPTGAALHAQAPDQLYTATRLQLDVTKIVIAQQAAWNKGDLDSFLIDITSRIFTRNAPETGKPRMDIILDKAGQKGTGKWTIMSALDMGVVVSTINAAVEARVTSSMKDAAKALKSGSDMISCT